jgi:hypothetical protein
VKLVAPIRRHNTAKGHHYKDASGTRVPGVTTLIDNGKPKKALINWSANKTAEAAVNRWDELALMPPATRLEELKRARYDDVDEAKKRGSEIHRLAEKFIKGETVYVPDELREYVEGYVQLLHRFKVEPVHVEFGIASYRHGYAGTGDLIADLLHPDDGWIRALIDLKSSRSGIFGEIALQLAAYRYADVLLEGDEEFEMPPVDATFAIHIRPSGSELIPVTTNPDVFRSFLYVTGVAAFEKESKDLIGAPVVPDTRLIPMRLVRDDA